MVSQPEPRISPTVASRRRPPAPHQPPLRQQSRHPGSIRGAPATCPALQPPASPGTFFTAALPSPASCQVSTEAGWAQKGASPPFSAFPPPPSPAPPEPATAPSPGAGTPGPRTPRHPSPGRAGLRGARPAPLLSLPHSRAPRPGGGRGGGGGWGRGRAGQGGPRPPEQGETRSRRGPAGGAAGRGGGEAGHAGAAPSPWRLPGARGSAAPASQPAAGAVAGRARLSLSSVLVFLIADFFFFFLSSPSGARWGWVKSRRFANAKGW